MGFFPVAGAVEGRGADGSGQVDGLASGPRVRLETWASAAREAVSWGPEAGEDCEVTAAESGRRAPRGGLAGCTGARPCDVRHHELEVKAVELGVCFSLWGGVGTAAWGRGRQSRPCVCHPRCGFAQREREARAWAK